MLDILDAASETLKPTKTYAERTILWIPASREVPEADGRLGNLTIKLTHRVRRCLVIKSIKPEWDAPPTYRLSKPTKWETDTYAVEADTPEPGDNGGRAFWLTNITDPDTEKPYRCVVGGLTPKCGCKAGDCKTETDKHLDALTFLVGKGYFDDLDPPGADAGRSGLAYQDEPGERTAAELEAA